MKSENFDRLIAGIATAVVVLLLLLALFFGSIGIDRNALAQASIPEPAEEEEIFIEPMEIVPQVGDPDETVTDENLEEAPSEQGEPEPAETDNDKVVVPGENPNPAPQRDKPIVQQKESPVKAVDPPRQPNKDAQKATSSVAKGFSGKNGKPDGKAGGFGTGGKGTASVHGVSRGREMLSCPKPSVALKNKVTVVVNVTVREDGTVASAKATGSASSDIRSECERKARQSKWTPKVGAGVVHGTITFNITPKL